MGESSASKAMEGLVAGLAKLQLSNQQFQGALAAVARGAMAEACCEARAAPPTDTSAIYDAQSILHTLEVKRDTLLAEPPGRWTFVAEASTASSVPWSGCWGCPPSPMRCPSDALLCDLNAHDRRALAPPEILSSDGEEVDDDLPSEIIIYPPTDDEGEPQVKAACELWPVPAPKQKRKYSSARTAVAMPGQASALPGTGACARALLETRPCGAKQQAVGQAAPPEVLRRPPGIFTFPVAKQTLAAPTTATRTPPPGIHRVQVAKETLAASATANGVAVARATVTAASTAHENHAHAAHEWKARANQPRITTLVVRNLHALTSQQEFLDEVNRSGFAEKYDFAYIPRGFEDGSGKGLAFINFKTVAAASAFAGGWHRSRRLSTKDEAGQVVPLNVSNATLQGLEANLRKWNSARMTRVKNADFLPFAIRGAEP